MSLSGWLSELHRVGVRLSADGERLRYDAPAGVLTPVLHTTLGTRKREILELLQATAATTAARIPPITRGSREGPLPLSFTQRGLWFLDQLIPSSALYNLSVATRLKGTLNYAALHRSVNELVARHEPFRTTFRAKLGDPYQIISPVADVSLPIVDCGDAADADGDTCVRRLVTQEAQRPFDLSCGPLLRASLFHLSDVDHVLLLAMPHIVSDGWSLGVLARELTALYDAYLADKPSPLADLPIQYADVVRWQLEHGAGILDAQLEYWTRTLADLTVVQLPTDYPRPAQQSFDGREHVLAVSKSLTSALHVSSRRENVTLFMTLLAAFNVLLHRYTGQDDIVVGSPNANRNRAEIEGLIGFFVNMLMMRTDLSGNPTLREVLSRVREVALGAYAHQDVPFQKVVEALAPERRGDGNPLFQVTFALQNAPMPPLAFAHVASSPMDIDVQATRFDLEAHVWEGSAGLGIQFFYRTDLFQPGTIAQMATHFHRILEAIASDPGQRLSDLLLLNEAERQELQTAGTGPLDARLTDLCIHEMFEAQAERTPEAIAVAFEDQQLTYWQLNRRADGLARHLQDLGVGPEVLVGVCFERSLEMVVALLAVFKAGGAYVPLDSASPSQRLALIVADTDIAVLLTQEPLLARLQKPGLPVVCPDLSRDDLPEVSTPSLRCGVRSGNLAYVLYTSGSTGRPKGVLVQHGGLCSLVRDHIARFGIGPGERVLQFASLSFDASAIEIFMAFCAGATLHVMPRSALSGTEIVELLRSKRITNAKFLPSVLSTLPLADLPALRTLIVGGEPCPAHLVTDWAPGRRFFNVYGPTESTVRSVQSECRPDVTVAGRQPPIGRPLSNTQVYILDRQLQFVPAGIAGQIYIGGVGVARGYHKQPGLTAEKFIPNPFGTEEGTRLYATGDLARWLPDGNIEFVGRIDTQIKVRGMRVELGEIEGTLAEHPGVREAVAIGSEVAPGDTRLWAYLSAWTAVPADVELQTFLRQRLPEYMLPEGFTWLDALPRTGSGKIDRRALTVPDHMRRTPDSGFVAARTVVEEVLAGIWREVLKVDHVSVDDNFFELGGHSLLAMQCISRAERAFSVALPLRRLFERPTVAGLAEIVEPALRAQHGLQVPSVRRVRKEGGLPLSFVQEHLWSLDRAIPGTPFFNLHVGVRLVGSLNVAVLEDVLTEIIRRHEILRTTFHAVGTRPVQVVNPVQRVQLSVADLSEWPDLDKEAEACRIGIVEGCRGFDLGRWPLLRATLLRLGATEHILFSAVHHIVFDGWSTAVLVREMETLYEAFEAGGPSPLAELPIQYGDFSQWQRDWLAGDEAARQLRYWQHRLTGDPQTQRSSDTPTASAGLCLATGSWSFTVSDALSRAVRQVSRSENATLFMTLLSAFMIVLRRWTGQDDVRVGTVVANRNHGETDGLIGLLVNTLVLRTHLPGDLTVREVLERVRETALGAYAHREMPFEMVLETLEREHQLDRRSLFQAMLLVQNSAPELYRLPNLRFDVIEDGLGFVVPPTTLDMILMMEDRHDQLRGKLIYKTHLFDDAAASAMCKQFQHALNSIASYPNQCIWEVATADESE